MLSSIIKQFRPILKVDTSNVKLRFYSPLFKDLQGGKSLNVTDSALNQLKVLKQKFPEKRLRLAVEAGGCHGFQYKFSLETDESNDSDTIFNAPQITDNTDLQIICDNVSWSILKDAKLDYSKELIGSSFRIIDNPVADNGCGCGVSFDLKSNKN